MRDNLQRKGTETNINFWFGSAIHFAMEEYFGYNKFGSLERAFQAYYAAFPAEERPEAADDHYYLGMGMLRYFQEWYPKHNEDTQFQTVWLDKEGNEVLPGTEGARPLVEESFMLDLGLRAWVDVETEEIIKIPDVSKVLEDASGHYIERDGARIYVAYVPIHYHGTMDRIVSDKYGRWWIMDWKTAKSADTNKLDTDDQISAYMWAAEQWFKRPIHGFVYVQLTKDLPKEPKRLKTTGDLSVDKKQKTTYNLFKRELIKDYGSVSKAPKKMLDFLAHLAAEETPEGDRFIRWDLVTRTKEQKISTYHHIVAEARMMIDPDLYLFPNPTRDCIWDCPFRDACLLTDQGNEAQARYWLDEGFEKRPREEDGNIEPWRENIPWPDSPNSEAIGTLIDQIETTANTTLNLILPEKYLLEEE